MLVPQTWLRLLLGAGMGISGILGMNSLSQFFLMYEETKFWAILEMAVIWCVLSMLPSRPKLSPQFRAGLEAVSLGMSVAIICSPFWVNDAFFFFEPDGWLRRWTHDLPLIMRDQAIASVAVTLTSAVMMSWKWAPLRAPWFGALAIVIATFAWFIPPLCVLALLGAVALITGRISTAILCGCMLAWWIGSFYFSLQWPLVHKAILLAASGCALGLATAFLFPGEPVKPTVPIALPQSKRTS